MEPCEPTIFDPNFNFNSTPAPNVTAIDAKQAADLVQKMACVDVRTSEEFGRGHLKGAINVPMLAAGPNGSRQVSRVVPPSRRLDMGLSSHHDVDAGALT